MKNYKTKGVVLKSFKLGEADKVITIITEKKGKVAAVAKGIRRTKSRFGARLEPFTDLELIIHEGRNLSTITQAEIVRLFDGVTGALDKINYGYAMIEMVDKMSVEDHPDPRIYRMLIKALDLLDKVRNGSELILATFDVKLLALTGFMPNLLECVVCSGKDKRFTDFSLSQGGVICKSCAGSELNSINISESALELGKKLLYIKFADLRQVKTDKSTLQEIERLIISHIAYHLNIRLKVREFINNKFVGQPVARKKDAVKG